MSDYYPRSARYAETDVGLRNFMVGTYRYMAMAMAVSGAVAYFFAQYLAANPGLIQALFGNWIVPVLLFVGVIVAFNVIGGKIQSMSRGAMLTFLFCMAAVLGLFSAPVAIFYDPVMVAKIFFMTTALFASLSLFGYTTRHNLWAYAKYAIPVFLGLIVLMFLGAIFPAFAMGGIFEIVVLVVMLIALSVIIAFQTQTLKDTYYSTAGDAALQENVSIFGATSLLLSFYNMFQILLSLFGSSE
ncbi:MAG: Bax inhibitor-1 family protein [Hyphomonadaceae bacterium]|nr:Bax inhibitor-1 family protein [Hyphomonadaceae bacterium]MBC6412593.1 Bax inhibitor-1 family protein [Hyphomonadaceae bacterium]